MTLRLYAGDHVRCFGPGVATLLHRVEQQHSLRAAAGSMAMAYSKAWRMIHTAEEHFQCKLLSSSTGGVSGGGAVLTREAAAFLAAYDALNAEVETFAQAQFVRRFPGAVPTPLLDETRGETP